MSDALGPAGGPDDPNDPLAAMFEALMQGGGLPPELANLPGMPQDPATLRAMMAQVQQMLAGAGDAPVNWDVAHDVARQSAAAGGDPSVTGGQARQVAEALRTADLWLDGVTELTAASGRTHAWSRAEWIERTLPVWRTVVEPIAESVAEAMATAISAQAPGEMQAMMGGALPMLRRMGGAFFGLQIGQALGGLAGEVVGGGDVGLPLLEPGQVALLPANVAAFGAGLGLAEDEVRLYLALREAAFARLVAGVPWLRSHLLASVQEYARGITIDMSAIEDALRQVDPSDVQGLQQALAGGLFEPARTPAQDAALERLETALALVEGWVDAVVEQAASGTLPHAVALQETLRRRRATGGPAEHTFATLVGLELRPRRLREAARVWAELARVRGVAGRDAAWSHPDLLPTTADLADPDAFVAGPQPEEGEQDMDSALEALLEQGLAEQREDDRPEGPEGPERPGPGGAG